MIVLAYIISFWVMAVVTYKIVKHEQEQIQLKDVKEKLDFYVEALKNIDRTLLKEVGISSNGLESLGKSITSLSEELAELKNKFNSVDKTAEDAKKLVSQIGIAQAFVPRNKRETKTAN